MVFQSFKNQLFKTTTLAGAGRHIVLTCNQAQIAKHMRIEACIFKCDMNRKNWSRNLNSVPHGPSNYAGMSNSKNRLFNVH